MDLQPTAALLEAPEYTAAGAEVCAPMLAIPPPITLAGMDGMLGGATELPIREVEIGVTTSVAYDVRIVAIAINLAKCRLSTLTASNVL